MAVQRSKKAAPRNRKAVPNPRTWKRTANQFFFGILLVDLGTYFAWAWYIFPVAFIGLLFMSDALGRKIFGLKTGGSIFLAMVVFLALVSIKLWAPEMFTTWEDHSTPLKWVLP